MSGEKQYFLRWSNFSDNIVTSLERLRGDEDFVDVTLACEGHSLKAHKVVLSACSQYIKKLLKDNPCAHPIIILKDVALAELTALISFMYNGQVCVSEDQIPQLIKTAEMLEIRGLAEITREAACGEEAAAPPSAPKRPCHERPQPMESEYDDEEEDEEEHEFEDESMEAVAPTDGAACRQVHVSGAEQPQQRLHLHHQAHYERKKSGCEERVLVALPSGSHRPVDIATRVSQMEDSMLAGDVLVIGETHITPARCVPPRPLKPPPPPLQQAPDDRLSIEMSLRLQVQRKLEAERLRAMERLRHAEAAAFGEGLMSGGPMDCSTSYPGTPNGGGGGHPEANGHHHPLHHHRDEGLSHQPPQPQQPVVGGGGGGGGVGGLALPLSPDLQLKMLMCRDFKKYTNMLLVAVFGREVLATHCLNGSKGSAKPRLDTDKVTRVIATVMEKFDVPASTVREAIRVKLNNEDKLKKRSKRTAGGNPLI